MRRHNPTTHEVTAVELTEANVHHCTVLPAFGKQKRRTWRKYHVSRLSKQKNVGTAYADGAYSFKQGFDAIAQSGGTPSIPYVAEQQQ